MSNNFYEEEKKYLEYVNKCIYEELESAKQSLQILQKKIVTYDDAKRGEQFTKEALMSLYASRISRLNRIIKSPYFGRMDFTPDDNQQLSKLYIGRTTISGDNDELAVIDWRSPVSSMYYDSSVGKASYLAPMGIIDGYISLKRQIIIEDTILKSILDTDFVTNDEILQKYLDVHADDRMKNIIASIQKEQNDIIRRPLNQNLIIQGVAGSGKTSVALHRIAYLLYLLNSDNKKVNSDQFLIIGPNNYFLDYISGVLPDLDVENVNQTTIFDLVSNLIEEKFSVLDATSELKEYYRNSDINQDSYIKKSQEFEKALNIYINDIINFYKKSNIEYCGIILFSKEEIANMLENVSENYRLAINTLEKRLIKRVKENYDEYYNLLTRDIKNEILILPRDSEKRKLLFEKLSLISKELKTGMSKTIKQHFRDINKKVLSHYATFIDEIEKYLDIDNIEEFKKRNRKRISKKTLSHDDLAAIIYLKINLDSVSDYNNILHVVIDEAQDLGVLDFKVLKQLLPNATFSIFGDLNQAIFSYRSIDDWNTLNNSIFNDEGIIINMDQSYRTTNEIMAEANKISQFLTGTASKDIIRHGNDVQYISCDDSDEINFVIKTLKKYEEQKYKSVAIICKTEEEAKEINDKLSTYGIDIANVSFEDRQYHGGLCTITCGLAKGLEFDATILINVDSINYNPEYDIDMKLLYVGLTRALHETSIISTAELPYVLKNEEQYVKKIGGVVNGKDK